MQEDPSALSQLFSVCSLLALHKTREIILVELSPSGEGREHQEAQMTNTRPHHIHNPFYTIFYPSIKLHLAISNVRKKKKKEFSYLPDSCQFYTGLCHENCVFHVIVFYHCNIIVILINIRLSPFI